MNRYLYLWVLAAIAGGACSGSREAVEVQRSVVVGSERIETVSTDLGYDVTVTVLRAAIRDVQFTTEGEEHETLTARVWSWLVPDAHAHPGHAGGGDVTGELVGDLFVNWMDDGAVLGTATLLEGNYRGANFLFRAASESDGLASDDPILGHTFHLQGTIEKDSESWTFDMVFDVEGDTVLIGAPFDHAISQTAAGSIAFELTTIDPFEGDTVFDGVEFSELDPDADGHIAIAPGDAAHNTLRRAFTRHDHYILGMNDE